MAVYRATHTNDNKQTPKAKRRVSERRTYHTGQPGSQQFSLPLPAGYDISLTRRQLFYGVVGLGVLAIAGGGISEAIKRKHQLANNINVLKVPTDAVTSSDSLSLLDDYNTCVSLVGNFELPYGSLVWASDSSVAACLIPTEGARPLTKVALLILSSGAMPFLLEGALGVDEGFEIYDVRATSSALIWTEADILEGIWRVYTAPLHDAAMGSPTLADEGDSAYEMPSLAAVANHVFWQVLPKPNGPKKTEDSVLKCSIAGFPDSRIIYTSHGRMATPIYALDDGVVITPRTDTQTPHYQLTYLDAQSAEIRDTLVLPSSMKPLVAGYGRTGFSFSFDAIYNFGDGISNLGTYTPARSVKDGNYNAAPWFCFRRSPLAAPAWCGSYFIVKSTRAICGIDMENNKYFALDVESGADDYGEYLASTGSHDKIVTFANIDHTPLSGKAIKCCRVRVWAPVP